MIDGVAVNVGDTVFVLGVGAGQVVRVEQDGGFTVKTGNGQVAYRSGGYIGNARRVFWHDPIFIVPPKNAQLWEAFKRMAASDYALLYDLFRSGKIPAVEADE